MRKISSEPIIQIPSEPKEKTANDLIPELILKINNYSSKLKDRVKIYSIFRELDTYARMNLRNFIKLSDKRYRCIKSGNNLQNVLRNQKNESNKLTKKIFENNLYSDKIIENEEKKLLKKTNNKESKELFKIRHEILEKTKDLSEKEVKKREKYVLSAQKSRNLKNNNIKEKTKDKKNITENTNNKTFSESYKKIKSLSKSMNWNFIKSFGNKRSKNYDDINTIDNETKNKTISFAKLNQDKELLKAKKEYLDNFIEKDNKNINENIIDYKQYLKDVENYKDKNFGHIINSGSNFGHTYSFKFNDIKLLSFQEEQKEVKKIKKKENPEIDIKKLVKYTKRGNRKWFLNNIKLRSKEKQNSFKANLKLKKHIYDIPKKRNEKSALIYKTRIENNIFRKINDKNILEDKNFSSFDTMGRTDSTIFTNFKNTIKTVKNEAELIQNIGKNFENKRKTMEGFFKRLNLPEIREYDKMFKTRNNFRKNKLFGNNKITYENLSPKSTKNIKGISKKSLRSTQSRSKKEKTDEDFINEKIFADMQRTYNDKKIIWAKEDLRKENIKKENLEHIERTKKYLEEMAHFKRKPHLYVDPYSKRDDLINDRIKLFTRSLSGPFYSQKKIQRRIDDFNSYIEQKEYEKKINDEKMAKSKKEDEIKMKEDDFEFQMKQKMKINLEKEKNENIDCNKDIKLNYKFIPTLKATKKKNKSKSYKDYQEFFDIVKNRQNRGYYDLYGLKDE